MQPTRFLLTLFVFLSSTLLAQGPDAPADAPPPKSTPPGPHAVSVLAYDTLASHTVYHPTDLSQFNGNNLLPIVSWGNGGCARMGRAFEIFLSQIASHGYIAIAIGPIDAVRPEPGAVDNTVRPLDTNATPSLDDQLLLDAIDWAVARNGDPASPLYGKLDPSKIAVMGQSCGGLQTMAVSHDPRITTSVIWNSGVLASDAPTPGGRILSAATKDSLNRLHAPIAYFIGGPSDIAWPNAEDDFARIGTVPVFKANLNVGHGGTYRDPGAGWFGEVGVAWLDWQLKNAPEAAAYFVGADCKLCTNPLWKVEKKDIP